MTQDKVLEWMKAWPGWHTCTEIDQVISRGSRALPKLEKTGDVEVRQRDGAPKEYRAAGFDMSQVLKSLGLSRPLAEMLAYLAEHKTGTVLEISAGTSLQQPRVCRGGLAGEKRGWIKLERWSGKLSRSHIVYSLTKPFSEVLEEIGAEKVGEAAERIEAFERLKELAA